MLPKGFGLLARMDTPEELAAALREDWQMERMVRPVDLEDSADDDAPQPDDET